MKITPEIIKEVECMLDMRKKNGEEIWEDGTDLIFVPRKNLLGFCYSDKFIVIKRKEARVESKVDPDLKPQHKFGEKVQGKPELVFMNQYPMEPDPYIQFLENWIPGIGEDTDLHDELHCHFRLGFSE